MTVDTLFANIINVSFLANWRFSYPLLSINNNNSNLNIQGMLLRLLWQKIKTEKEITISNCTHYIIFLSQQKLKILFKSQLLSLSLSAAQEIINKKNLWHNDFSTIWSQKYSPSKTLLWKSFTKCTKYIMTTYIMIIIIIIILFINIFRWMH